MCRGRSRPGAPEDAATPGGRRGSSSLPWLSPPAGADSLTPSAPSPANQGAGRGEATGQWRVAAVREPANGVEAAE